MPNLFDQFDPAPQGNVFDQFDAKGPAQPPQPPSAASAPVSPSSASPPSQPDLGSTAIWNKPTDVSWTDYFMAHAAKPFQGANQAAQDYARVAGDAATFGLGDRLQSSLTGSDLAQERAETEAARSRLGVMAPITEGAMYAVGPGELGLASKAGGWLAPTTGKWLGGVLGSAAEGTAMGAAGAAGHDQSIGTGALTGALLGAAGGLPGGVVGRGGTLAAPTSTADLQAAKTAAYAPLDQIVFHGPSQIAPVLDAVERTMSGYESDLAKSTMAQVNKLRDQGLVTASDIQSAQKRLGKIAGSLTAGDEDKNFAPQFSNALEGVMQNAQPYGRNLTPGKGMNLMQHGAWGGTGLAPGDAAAARDAGDALYGRLQDVNRLNDMQTTANIPGATDIGQQAASWLRSDKGQILAPQGSPRYQAWSDLAKTAGVPNVSAGPSAWDYRHALHPLVTPLIGAAVGAGGGGIAEGHFDPAHMAEEALTGAALGYGLHRGVPWIQGLIQGPAQQRAVDAARSTLSTGQYQVPVLSSANLRDALRNVLFGTKAAGSLF